MAGVVNLRTARKARSRVKARAGADENAARFGRTKTQKSAGEKEAAKARATLDAHRREDPET